MPKKMRGSGMITLPLMLLFILGCNPKADNNTRSEDKPDGIEKPNILFIMADDLGYGDLGCYGQTSIITQNIDRLAKEGTRFTQCYAGSTVCAPSRSTLMTGQHTGHTTVRGNSALANGPAPEGRIPLHDEDITVAEVLKTVGYITGIAGKWGLGEPGTSGVPNRQGFDEWFGYLNQRKAHSYYPSYLWKDTAKVILEGNRQGKKGVYSHDLFTEFALDFITRHKDSSFFLYLPYTIPHARYEIPETDPYTHEAWNEEEKIYAAMVTRLDRDVGKIVSLLQELKLEEQTIVFFCSDNGAAKRWDGRFDSSGLLRGKKRDMYEGGIRVPMIVWWPGTVPAGRTSDQVWYFPDLLPTLAELVNVDIPEGVDGESMLGQILGSEPVETDRVLYWEFTEHGFQQALRWGQWKAVRLKAGAPLALYDLKNDPREQDNIAGENPAVIRKITQMLDTIRTESIYWPVASERDL